ncbi:MDR family MFS transporter [Pseudogracilibacillus auburnensis]|uniref:EmrB/QacA subfamily drug resistance transporter n=1 Tax=Pseudogracilibacillus auburnensis TaxID=1494959 RepID=A0A2V3W8F7_9BACI|nr:MDR family MFS transporter [Pseudogracilibacillus auburnensis]MBO1003573.1 MFS transporter [Pseudogracilibacillus auburnensis]PXW89261.1 EmrB/QacA subfamily drug resistance transporter [Pseudogracilibacillus auburnensis]
MNTKLKRPFILASVMLGMFLSAIEATIVATAMPSIVADLQNFSLYSWVFSAYLLSSSATVLIFGKLADLYGRRPIYTVGICIFLIGSTIAGFSTTMVMLIISRFIQGVGAGAIMPIATTIVGDIYTKTERAKVQGYLSAVWGISAIIGPLIGAFFVDFFHWRLVFWMNLPLGLLSMIGIFVFLKEKMKKEKRSIDFIGTFLLITSISILMYVLVEGGISISWNSIQMWILIGVVLVTFLLFIIHGKRIEEPIIPSHIWTYRMIKVANIASLFTGMILISVSSYLPTFVQGVLGKSAIIAGFTLTAMSIGWPIASTVAGRLLLIIGYRKTSILGGISLLIGTGFFMLLPVIQQPFWAGIGSFFVGIGMGMTSTSFIVAIQTTVKWEVRGIATATNMFMRTIGSALGVAFLGGILNNQINREIEQANLTATVTVDAVDQLLDQNEVAHLSAEAVKVLQQGLLSGLTYVYIGVCAIALISFIVILFIPHREKIQE